MRCVVADRAYASVAEAVRLHASAFVHAERTEGFGQGVSTLYTVTKVRGVRDCYKGIDAAPACVAQAVASFAEAF